MAEAANNVRRGVPMATPVFDGAKEADIETMLEMAGLDRFGAGRRFMTAVRASLSTAR